MYSLTLGRNFEANHYLVGGDWGEENELHSHRYRMELELAGEELNEHGFLVDLVELEQFLERSLSEFEGKTLNDHPAFSGLNPSLEHFSRVLSELIGDTLDPKRVLAITVRLWEDDTAWASFHRSRP